MACCKGDSASGIIVVIGSLSWWCCAKSSIYFTWPYTIHGLGGGGGGRGWMWKGSQAVTSVGRSYESTLLDPCSRIQSRIEGLSSRAGVKSRLSRWLSFALAKPPMVGDANAQSWRVDGQTTIRDVYKHCVALVHCSRFFLFLTLSTSPNHLLSSSLVAFLALSSLYHTSHSF